MKYKKLVRDRIPEIIKAKGGKPVFYKANRREFLRRLKDKLREEVVEFLESGKTEEIADILEVVDAIVKEKGISQKYVRQIQKEKARIRGKFKKRIVLEEA